MIDKEWFQTHFQSLKNSISGSLLHLVIIQCNTLSLSARPETYALEETADGPGQSFLAGIHSICSLEFLWTCIHSIFQSTKIKHTKDEGLWKTIGKKLADVFDTETDMDREREFFFHLLVLKIGFKGQVFNKRYCYCQVKSSHLYLYSAFNNTNCVNVTAQYQNKENSVSLM